MDVPLILPGPDEPAGEHANRSAQRHWVIPSDDGELRPPRASDYVNVYVKALRYGGAEEGGWWYTEYDPAEEYATNGASVRYTPEAFRTAENWVNEQNMDQPPLHSVASHGLYVMVVEDHKAEYKPARRPHYE